MTDRQRSGWNLRLHPEALTPDPAYSLAAAPDEAIDFQLHVYPWQLVRHWPTAQPNVEAWGQRLTGDRDPGPLVLKAGDNQRADLVIDFGTELEGCLELEIELPNRATMLNYTGELLMEVEGDFNSTHPPATQFAHFATAGVHTWRLHPKGLRFARFLFHDIADALTIRSIKVDSQFVFRNRIGDLRCDDDRFQRAWQTSVYTARLCTRPDTFWDGIKRDRHGWFGDARITKEVVDAVYHDPRPSREMLTTLPTDTWANNVPIYSFDAIAMLHQHGLAYGLGEDCIAPAFERIIAFLDWVATTQLNDDGFITLDPSQRYFGKIGFLDWSKMPVGGRFEELCWLQCKHVEGLRTAAILAHWLGREDLGQTWRQRADRIGRRIVDVFWRPDSGFVHTLNHVGEVENPHLPGWGGHYDKTYEEGIRLGESGPSRQACALAIWAGLADESMQATMLEQVFANPAVEPVITAYFKYYELMAHAAAGDKQGAVEAMRDYLTQMLEARDAATVIEMYDPRVTDFRQYCNHFSVLHLWPLSYCHGWGSGLVPIAQRHLMGLAPQAPGWSQLAIEAPAALPMAFDATVSTHHGPLRVTRDDQAGPVRYRVPAGIEVVASPEQGVVIEQA